MYSVQKLQQARPFAGTAITGEKDEMLLIFAICLNTCIPIAIYNPLNTSKYYFNCPLLAVTRSSSTNFTTALRTNNRRSTTIRAAAADDDDVGIAGTAAIALGLAANPIVLWSEYTLATTGAGLQGDILGAAEGVSYLVVLGLVGWSLKTKVSTGSGLPAGEYYSIVKSFY